MILLMSLSFLAMVLFCLAMEKHRQQVINSELPPFLIHSFRPLAWLLLIITFYISGEIYGWSIGPAVYFGALTAALFSLILLLTYQARIVPLLSLISPLIACVNFYC